MREQKGTHEPYAPSLFWLERPVCLERPEVDGEGSPARRQGPAGWLLEMIRTSVAMLCSILSSQRRGLTR
jgi:hypothetical protein